MRIEWVRLTCASAVATMIAVHVPAPAAAGDEPPRAAFRSEAFPWDAARPAAERADLAASGSPQSALDQMERSYRSLDLDRYAAILTADYRFITCDPRFDDAYPDGFSRVQDIASMAGLFGVTRVPGKPAISSIEFDLGLVGGDADPDHPDSLEHYRLLIAPNPMMIVHAADDARLEMTRTLLAFYMVRGDAAVLAPNAPATAEHWYLRRWVETPEQQMAEGGSRGIAGEQPLQPSLRLAENPASGPFELVISVPEAGEYRIDVFDAAGRRTEGRPALALPAGATRFALRDTGALPAGIYWLRLSRAGKPLATRVATRL